MSSRQGQTIQWSSYNYPTTISAGSGSTAESVSLGDGPDRARWQQIYTGNGTSETTDYVGGLMDVVISGTAIDYRHYIYAGSEPVAVYSRKSSGLNTFSYMLSDHQSSVAKITNSSGAVVVSESFTPSGNRRNPATWSGSASTADLTTSAGISRQGYTFQTQLGLWMGLNHMNGRVQDAIIGRMISADPHITDPTDAQSYNRYSYVNNNPLTLVDPTGFINKYPSYSGGGGGDWYSGSYDPDTGITTESFGDSNSGTSAGYDPSGLCYVCNSAAPATGNVNSPASSDSSTDAGAPAQSQQQEDQPTSEVNVTGTSQGNQGSPPGVSCDGDGCTVTVCAACTPLSTKATAAVISIQITVGAMQNLFMAPRYPVGWNKTPKKGCTNCGWPHSGTYGDYCPDCQGKSLDPNGGVPPNPSWNGWGDDDEKPLPGLDDNSSPYTSPLWETLLWQYLQYLLD
jgi:RHS repeat-associated protein